MGRPSFDLCSLFDGDDLAQLADGGLSYLDYFAETAEGGRNPFCLEDYLKSSEALGILREEYEAENDDDGSEGTLSWRRRRRYE